MDEISIITLVVNLQFISYIIWGLNILCFCAASSSSWAVMPDHKGVCAQILLYQLAISKEIFSGIVLNCYIICKQLYSGSQCVSLTLSQIQLLADLDIKKTPQLAELVADDNGKVWIIMNLNVLHVQKELSTYIHGYYKKS